MIRKFGSLEAFNEFKAVHGLVPRANEVGLDWNEEDLSKRIQSSTLKSHRLVQWVAHQFSLDKSEELYAALNYKHFSHGGILNDMNLLLDCIHEVGIDSNEAKIFLDSTKGENEILNTVDLVHQYGINSIPTLIIDGQYILNGATHTNEICQALRSIQQPTGKMLFSECLKI
mmetsp:Transcript_6323/g.8173  ORF Transcript_6323/g.8173 Transcript_6323/m.8173 type:complete len:172 (-) Transcript_6323:138-653(-)